MMASCPATRRRPPSRKLRVSREQLTSVRAVVARGAARRARIPAGHPGALSWELASWTDDDAAWFVTAAHPGGLAQWQVAQLMGISQSNVSYVEVEALEKLRLGFEAILAEFTPSALETELGIALEPEDFLIGMFELFDRFRRAEARAAARAAAAEARAAARAAAGLIHADAAPYDAAPPTQSHCPHVP
jgi:hypothetical protein